MININQRNKTGIPQGSGEKNSMLPETWTVYGPAEILIVPKRIAFKDSTNYLKAIASWRFDLNRELIRIWDAKAKGLTKTQMEVELQIPGTTLDERIRTLHECLGVTRGTAACTMAGHYGLGLD